MRLSVRPLGHQRLALPADPAAVFLRRCRCLDNGAHSWFSARIGQQRADQHLVVDLIGLRPTPSGEDKIDAGSTTWRRSFRSQACGESRSRQSSILIGKVLLVNRCPELAPPVASPEDITEIAVSPAEPAVPEVHRGDPLGVERNAWEVAYLPIWASSWLCVLAGSMRWPAPSASQCVASRAAGSCRRGS